MSIRVITQAVLTDANLLLKKLGEVKDASGNVLTATVIVAGTSVGYHIQGSDKTRKASFLVDVFGSRVKVFYGFKQDFDESSGSLINMNDPTIFSQVFSYKSYDEAARSIAAWIFDSRLLGFTTEKLEELKPIAYEAPVPVRNYATGKRQRNNIILQFLELADSGLINTDVINEWFFLGRSAKETVRRLKRIARYGYKLRFKPWKDSGWSLFLNTPSGKTFDLKLVISKEHAERIRKAFDTVDDAKFNENAYGFIIVQRTEDFLLYYTYLKKWSVERKEAQLYHGDCIQSHLDAFDGSPLSDYVYSEKVALCDFSYKAMRIS